MGMSRFSFCASQVSWEGIPKRGRTLPNNQVIEKLLLAPRLPIQNLERSS